MELNSPREKNFSHCDFKPLSLDMFTVIYLTQFNTDCLHFQTTYLTQAAESPQTQKIQKAGYLKGDLLWNRK